MKSSAHKRRQCRDWSFERLEDRLVPAIWMVANLSSNPAVSGSLPWAVAQANSDQSGTPIAIDFSAAAGQTFATAQTITLSGTQVLTNAAAPITITGPAAGVTLSGNTTNTVLEINSGVQANLSGLAITAGAASVADPTNEGYFDGGGIFNSGTLVITNSTFSANSATAFGGAIDNSALLYVENSTFVNNIGQGGGAIFTKGPTTVSDCTFTGNKALVTAPSGFWYQNSGFFTLFTPLAGQGGAILTESALTLADSTLNANIGSPGGAIGNGGQLTLQDDIVAGNEGITGPDLFNSSAGTLNDLGSNLLGTTLQGVASGPGDVFSDQPELAPLGDYGGPTQTMAPLPGSPAIAAGGPASTQTIDQRGFSQPGEAADIGAFQSQALVVNTTADQLPGASGSLTGVMPGQLSLREALNLANLATSAVTISFADGSGQTFATPQTINLSGTLVLANTAAPIGIDGPAAALTLSGNNTFTILEANSGVQANLSGLTITAGFASIADPDYATVYDGGAIYNSGTMTVSNLAINANAAASQLSFGGGIFNFGTLTVSDATFSNNTANAGGAIENKGTLTVNDSTFSLNFASDVGGGIENEDQLTVTNTTFTHNSAKFGGGGIANESTATVTNCTLFDNSAGTDGGGILNDGYLNLTSTTLFANSSQAGGGIYAEVQMSLVDSIVAGNTATTGPDIQLFQSNVITAENHNLLGTALQSTFTGTGDVFSDQPLLGALGSFGGPTQTLPLLPGSPALAAGIPVTNLTLDQRGLSRPSSVPDIGAFQSQGFTLTISSAASPQIGVVGIAFLNPLAVTVTADNPLEPVDGGIVTFTQFSGAQARVRF